MNNTLITVLTSSVTQDLAVPQSLLESEGIYTFVQDELISQIYAPAFGAKLQVRKEDAGKAILILKEGGFIKEEDLEPTSVETKLYKFLSRIPFIKNIYK